MAMTAVEQFKGHGGGTFPGIEIAAGGAENGFCSETVQILTCRNDYSRIRQNPLKNHRNESFYQYFRQQQVAMLRYESGHNNQKKSVVKYSCLNFTANQR